LLAEVGLHWFAFSTLWCLWLEGELETRHLADKTGVAKNTLSGILNMLEKRKLVHRRVHELERRLVLVELTAAGAEQVRTLVPKCSSEEARITSGLTPDQLRATTVAIRAILATIRQLDAQMQRPSCSRCVRPGRRRQTAAPAADAGFYGWRHGPHYAI